MVGSATHVTAPLLRSQIQAVKVRMTEAGERFHFIIISRECEHFPECQDKPDKMIVDFYMCVSVFVCLYIVFNFLCCSSSLQSFTTVVQRPSLRASGGLGPNSTFLLQFPAPKAPSVCYHFNIDWLYFYTTGTGRCH